MVAVGVDNKRVEEHGDYEPSPPTKKARSITGKEWHVQCASGPLSSELILYKRQCGDVMYPERSACDVFVTFGPTQVTLCVKFSCDITYIIITTRMQLNTYTK